ncbi:MAG: chemotaxis-specific protein-glutamate methyltransferase CheB [Thermoflexales bacterium]|nr:chemotaxis-specific protein-glutamate methyltransferase CheB [Thermoflexales bacterium]
MKETIRVLIVDDSPLIRTILNTMLEDAGGIQVVGQARDGEEAVSLAASLRPDVITMDIRMPRMNGLEATRQIMSTRPTPIVVLATSIYDADMNIAFNAVASGALTVVEKPKGLDPEDFEAVRDQVVGTIRMMSGVQLVSILPGQGVASSEARPILPLANRPLDGPVELIAMVASTGGPGTLRQILADLPAELAVPIVVLQRVTPGFGHGFANWLRGTTALDVAIAEQGHRLAPSQVVLAAEGRHLTIAPGGVVQLEQSEPVSGQRPSATRLFDSLAAAYGPTGLGIVLSGMGDDGIDGLEKLWKAGGHIIAQDEDSCAVFEMPRLAIERGIVDAILPPAEIVREICRLNGSRM